MMTREELVKDVEDARNAIDAALDNFEANDAWDILYAAHAALIAYDKENT
jgi:hypothetical protein